MLDFPENPSRVLVFESTSSLNDLVSLICEQTNLYAAQNGRSFVAATEEVKAFLDVYLLISICKLPNIKCYWHADIHLGNEGIRYILTRTGFLEILQNLHFVDNNTPDTSGTVYKLRSVINHLTVAFQTTLWNANQQSIDENMDVILTNIKWEFKWWCQCSSTTGYIYEPDLYLGKKDKTELGLGESVVLNLSEKLEDSYCKGESTKKSLPCPEMIKDYNSDMSAVDLLDQKTAA